MVALVDSLIDSKIECKLTRSNLVVPKIPMDISEPVLPGENFYEPLEIVEDDPETYGITNDYNEWKKSREEFNSSSRMLETNLITDVSNFPIVPTFMLHPVACDYGKVIITKSFKYDTMEELLAALPKTKFYLYDFYEHGDSHKIYIRYAV